jgi:hypothetical protein
MITRHPMFPSINITQALILIKFNNIYKVDLVNPITK